MSMPTVIKDRNAGNSANTYWKPSKVGSRDYCVEIGSNYLRDARGRVRRFATREAAERAISRMAAQ